MEIIAVSGVKLLRATLPHQACPVIGNNSAFSLLLGACPVEDKLVGDLSATMGAGDVPAGKAEEKSIDGLTHALLADSQTISPVSVVLGVTVKPVRSRKRRRHLEDIPECEIWRCNSSPCAKIFKRTSSISIQNHRDTCRDTCSLSRMPPTWPSPLPQGMQFVHVMQPMPGMLPSLPPLLDVGMGAVQPDCYPLNQGSMMHMSQPLMAQSQCLQGLAAPYTFFPSASPTIHRVRTPLQQHLSAVPEQMQHPQACESRALEQHSTKASSLEERIRMWRATLSAAKSNAAILEQRMQEADYASLLHVQAQLRLLHQVQADIQAHQHTHGHTLHPAYPLSLPAPLQEAQLLLLPMEMWLGPIPIVTAP
jgi:hypothetical protein